MHQAQLAMEGTCVCEVGFDLLHCLGRGAKGRQSLHQNKKKNWRNSRCGNLTTMKLFLLESC